MRGSGLVGRSCAHAVEHKATHVLAVEDLEAGSHKAGETAVVLWNDHEVSDLCGLVAVLGPGDLGLGSWT